ncbi:unnamed protein product [Penicillium glandicola]
MALWSKVPGRIPGLTDCQGARDYSGDDSDIPYASGQNDNAILAEIEEEEDEDNKFLSKFSIQVLWVNEHGQTLWENRVEPSIVTDLSTSQWPKKTLVLSQRSSAIGLCVER